MKERKAVAVRRAKNERAAGSYHRPDKEQQSVHLSFAAVPLPRRIPPQAGPSVEREAHSYRLSARELYNKYWISLFYRIVLMGRVVEDADPYNQGIRQRAHALLS